MVVAGNFKIEKGNDGKENCYVYITILLINKMSVYFIIINSVYMLFVIFKALETKTLKPGLLTLLFYKPMMKK